LALVWQFVRRHSLETLGGWTEEKLLEWANGRITDVPKIPNFKDKTLATS